MKKRFFLLPLLLCCSFLLSAQQDSLLADSIYTQAKDLYYDGKYDEAQPLFQQSLSLKKKYYGTQHEAVMWNYRRLALTAEELRDYQTAFIYYDSAIALAIQLKGREHDALADIYYDVGFAHASTYQVRKANEYFNQALKIREKINGKESVEVAALLTQIGNNFLSAGDYRTAEEYLLRALAMLRQQLKPGSREFYAVFNYLGYLNRKLENFDQALIYAKQALEIKLKHYAPDHPSVAKYHRNIGRIYQMQGEYEKAFPYFEKAMKIAENALGPDHPSTGGQYGEMGNILADLERYDEAIQYVKLATKIRSRYNDTLHPLVIAGDHNIALIYHDQGDYKNALKYHKIGLRKFLSRSYPPPDNVIKAYRDISLIYEDMDQPLEGLKANREAMRWLAPGFEPAVNDFFSIPDLQQVRSPIDYLNALEDRAYLLRKWFEEDTTKVIRLAEALNSLDRGVNVIENLRRRYDSEAARTYLNKNRSGIFELGVQTTWELYQKTGDQQLLKKAFELSEKSRASILWQSLQENIALRGAGLESSFLTELENIGTEIGRIEGELSGLQETNGTKEEIAAVERILFEKNQAYETQVTLLEKMNPRYYQLKYANAQIDWPGLESLLKENGQTLLEYFYDDEQLYLFTINGNGIDLKVQQLPEGFVDWIELIRGQKVNTLLKGGGQWQQDYRQALHNLYDLLISPVAEQIAMTDQLLIIPYGVLQYLPFGILASSSTTDHQTGDFRQLSYLIKSHSIQYAWSVSLLQQKHLNPTNYQQDYLGFAPQFSQPGTDDEQPLFAFRSQLTALTFNQREIKNSQNYFSGLTYLGDQATEQQFCLSAPHSRILHLATHTLIDDEHPLQSGLVFSATTDSTSDGFLSLREIYDLHLPADLAVMSACNTGFGKLSKGEGVLSLGRAFSYAGCRSILMSLWLSNDQSTASLMDHFYQHLAQGKNKDTALRQAKLDYLATADGLMAHPYFWGGMVVVGERDALNTKNGIAWFWWFGGILLLVALVGWCKSMGL